MLRNFLLVNFIYNKIKLIIREILIPFFRSLSFFVYILKNLESISQLILIYVFLMLFFYDRLEEYYGEYFAIVMFWFAFILIIGVIAVHFAAFVLHIRSRFQAFYGSCEVSFGVISISYAIVLLLRGGNFGTMLITICAGLYIIIRGFDNIERSPDGNLAKVFYKRITQYISSIK